MAEIIAIICVTIIIVAEIITRRLFKSIMFVQHEENNKTQSEILKRLFK